MPKCPTGLTRGAQAAWRAWFEAWWAAFWVPGDLPGLPQVVRLYDAVERGRFQQHAELRLAMDTYGITPKVGRTGAGCLRSRQNDPILP